MSVACTTELAEEEPATKIGATSKAESYFEVSVMQEFVVVVRLLRTLPR